MYFVVKLRVCVTRSGNRYSRRVGGVGWGVIGLCRWIRQVRLSDVGDSSTGKDVR